VPIPLVGVVQQALDPWLMLRSAEAAAEAMPAGRRATVMGLRADGDRRFDAALGERGVPALILARTCVPYYLEAAVTARGSEASPEHANVAQLWGSYDEIVRAGLLPEVPVRLAPARRRAIEERAAEAEVAVHGEACIDEALELASFLAGAIEMRTPRAVRLERTLRKAVVVTVALFALGEGVMLLPKSASLALHASVVSSSRRPDSGPPQDLTNGKIEAGTAFATKDEADPWVTIDLGPPARVSEVTLVNSEDHLADSLPLRVETSSDGTTWDAAGEQTKPFSPAEPGVLTFTARSARFVRIHGHHGGAIYLNEVEVR